MYRIVTHLRCIPSIRRVLLQKQVLGLVLQLGQLFQYQLQLTDMVFVVAALRLQLLSVNHLSVELVHRHLHVRVHLGNGQCEMIFDLCQVLQEESN